MCPAALATSLAAPPHRSSPAMAMLPSIRPHPLTLWLALAPAAMVGFADRGAVIGFARVAPVIRWRHETGRWLVQLCTSDLYSTPLTPQQFCRRCGRLPSW